MKTPKTTESARIAILTIAEIKAAVAAFDRGDVNAFDTLRAVLMAITMNAVAGRARPRRRAA